jgi:hypothetical protein
MKLALRVVAGRIEHGESPTEPIHLTSSRGQAGGVRGMWEKRRRLL